MKTDLILQRLQAVLALERDLLRAGKFDGLTRLANDKIKLTSYLARAPLNAAVAGRIKRDMERNARLMQAAAHGIKQALRQTQRPPTQPLTTYNANGHTASISTTTPSISQRL